MRCIGLGCQTIFGRGSERMDAGDVADAVGLCTLTLQARKARIQTLRDSRALGAYDSPGAYGSPRTPGNVTLRDPPGTGEDPVLAYRNARKPPAPTDDHVAFLAAAQAEHACVAFQAPLSVLPHPAVSHLAPPITTHLPSSVGGPSKNTTHSPTRNSVPSRHHHHHHQVSRRTSGRD